jgi:hypothetical protein
MIEVGVDIDRLGLLTVFGQPKSSAQYIQVTGRIGRRATTAPGVVFVLLSPFNARDRSHYEQFSAFHRRLYASVEPVSVTPFTPAALERGLAGALTAWLRSAVDPARPADARRHFDDAFAVIADRARAAGADLGAVTRRGEELRQLLAVTTHEQWGVLHRVKKPDKFLRLLGRGNDGAPALGDEDENACWAVPNSMRSVDTDAGAKVTDVDGADPRAGVAAPGPGPATTPGHDEDEY